MSDAWSPIHHEEADEPGPDPADKRPAKESSEKTDTGSPVSLVLGLPKEVTTAITMVADRLERVALAIEENTKEVSNLARAVMDHAEITQQAMDAVAQERTEDREALASHMKHLGAVGEAQEVLSGEMKAWMGGVEKALLAPRSVKLERDKDGKAIGATSEVTVH